MQGFKNTINQIISGPKTTQNSTAPPNFIAFPSVQQFLPTLKPPLPPKPKNETCSLAIGQRPDYGVYAVVSESLQVS